MASKIRPLIGHVCLVTGAFWGIKKGIVLQLSEAGATVYITAQHQDILEQMAAEVQNQGGKCMLVVCDSTREEDVVALFQRMRQEQAVCLDVLVNSAFSAVTTLSKEIGVPFWESEPSLWDQVNNAGLRGNYFCMVHAHKDHQYILETGGKRISVF